MTHLHASLCFESFRKHDVQKIDELPKQKLIYSVNPSLAAEIFTRQISQLLKSIQSSIDHELHHINARIVHAEARILARRPTHKKQKHNSALSALDNTWIQFMN